MKLLERLNLFKPLFQIHWGQVSAICIFLAVMMLVVWGVGVSLNSWLEYDRALIVEGQWWRLFTCNFVHFTLWHTAMNCAGLVALGLWLWPRNTACVLVLGIVVQSLCVGGGMLLLDHEIHLYRGFSGVFWGLLLMALILQFQSDRWVFGLAIAFLLGKILFEQTPWFDVHYLTAEIGAEVGNEAHLYGVVGAGVLLVFIKCLRAPWLTKIKDLCRSQG